jgi:hypothetical protein
MMEMKIIQYDDSKLGAMDNVTRQAYLQNSDNYSLVPMRPKTDPADSWAVPYVTGKKYKIHWHYGLDFTQMRVDLSPKWSINDKSV